MMAIVDSPARQFLAALGPGLPQPLAVVVFSAHHDASSVEITGGSSPETIHDFGGFPAELYRLVYPAPGAPELAREIEGLLAQHALEATVNPVRGFDHGAWIPLRLMFPAADVPLVQVSIDTARAPAHHVALGSALRPLREHGVLLIGSGGATHNLGLYFRAGSRADDDVPEWVRSFAEWTAAAVAEGRLSDLERYREIAPFAPENHPTPEHFLPLFPVLGAAFEEEIGMRIHSSYDRGLLSLDAFAFGLDDWPGPVFPAASQGPAV